MSSKFPRAMSEKAINFSTYHKFFLNIYKLVAFDIRCVKDVNDKKIKYKILLNNALFAFYILNVILFYCLTFFTLMNRSDEKVVTIMISCIISPLIVVIKAVIVFNKKSEISELLTQFNRFYTVKEEVECEFGCYRKMYKFYIIIVIGMIQV